MKKEAGLIGLVMAAACFLNFMPGVTPVNASVKKNTKIEENKTSSEKSEADADKTDAQKGGKSGGKNNTPDKGTEDQDLYIEADSLCCLARDMYIEDMMSHYCINIVDDGKYSDYEGDIGDVILEYKDVDLDGDGEPDAIKRKGQKYVIKFSDGGTLETGDFSSLPNEGEVIEFADISEDNVDEILFTHYTEGTAGPAAWDTTLYTRVDGEWTAFPVINENGINSTELQKDIEKRTGEAYAPESVRVAGVQLTDSALELLLDYGTKDGPEQILDYDAVTLFKAFNPNYMDDDDEFRMLSSDISDFVRNWPIEFTGKGLSISPDIQYKANIFLSNFSEQHYSGNSDYNSAEYAHFALEWMELNKYKEIDTSNGDCRIDQAQINKVLERYFGTVLDESDFYNADVNNVHNGTIERGKDGKSYYCEPAAEGELYRNNAFSMVWQMEDLGSGNKNDPAKDRYLRMYFTVYSLPDEVYEETGIGKKQYSLNEKDAEKEASKSELFEEGAGFAIVNEVSPGEYRLMYYYLYHQMMEP